MAWVQSLVWELRYLQVMWWGPKIIIFFFLINDAVCGYWPLDSHSSVSPQFSRKQETAEAQYYFNSPNF